MTRSSRRKPITRLAAMRGRTHISLLVCVSALTLAACGGDDGGTIPPDEADNLLSQLEAVQGYVDDGDCLHAEQQVAELINQVNALPSDVDPKVESELTKAADNLRGMTADPTQCGASGITGAQPTEETDTTDTETTEPETTVTETTTPEEETTTEEQPEEEQPQEQQPPEEQPEEQPTPAPGGGQSGGTSPTQSGGLEVPDGSGGGGG